MRKKVLGLAFIFGLLFPAVAGLLVDFATANPTFNMPYITIQSDGTIEPQTDLVYRNGNVYCLTANLTQNALKIMCSNIVFDRSGYYIIGGNEGSKGFSGNAGLMLENVGNVTAKNVHVIGFVEGITLEGCMNCSVLRVNVHAFVLQDSNYNAIAESNISGAGLPLLLRNSTGNMIYSNNIEIADVVGANFWDNGSIGNYWSDYIGVDSNGDGIGDTPYVVDAPYNIDNYPLMEPFTIQESQPSPTPSQGPQLEPKEETSVPLTLIAGVSAVSIAIAGVAGCLFYYRKKHSR